MTPTPRVTGHRPAARIAVTLAATLAIAVLASSVAGAVGPPDSPTVTGVTSTLTAVQVTFTPGADNGSAITGFSATCTSANGGSPGTQVGGASPISVGSLTTGKTYTCTVTASNAIGTSPASTASAAIVPAAAPAAPTSVEVLPLPTAAATGSLRVKFANGGSNGSAVTGYSASCTSGNGGASGSASGAAPPLTVAALTTGKRYACTVTATNARGTSPASAVGRATVGAPAAPAVLDVISLPQGIAVVVRKNTDNGSPVISYRARCTSSNGGLPGSPVQLASPVIATGLTPGATYTCAVTANNLRGESPERVSSAVVVGDPFSTTTCTGSAGTVTLAPGLRLAARATQSIALTGTFGSCTGGYVTSAVVSVNFRSAAPMHCADALDPTMTSGGFGRITWKTPTAMGASGATVRFRFLSTSGHTTQVKFYGTVTQRGNLFTDRHISGRLTLNAGLAAAAAGGDCRATTPLTTFGVTSLRFTIT